MRLLASTLALLASTFLAAPHWQPPQELTFYWQLQGTPSIHAVMATDIDGFDSSPATVAALHTAGQHVICYIDAGTWEEWRSDATQFPTALRGAPNGWPGEKWLDIRNVTVLKALLAARIRMCADKGFDAVEPDNLDAFTNHSGFPITAADQLHFNKWIAAEAHAQHLAVFLKNDPGQAAQLQPFYDGVITEECNQFHECSAFQPFLAAGKPVLDIEYEASLYPAFCTADNTAHIMGALLDKNLSGKKYEPCWLLVGLNRSP